MKYRKKELIIGTKIEMEHTSSKKMAMKIAKDHLREFPNYYTKGVIPMEKKLKMLNKSDISIKRSPKKSTKSK